MNGRLYKYTYTSSIVMLVQDPRAVLNLGMVWVCEAASQMWMDLIGLSQGRIGDDGGMAGQLWLERVRVAVPIERATIVGEFPIDQQMTTLV
jgi:hypothetical protein